MRHVPRRTVPHTPLVSLFSTKGSIRYIQIGYRVSKVVTTEALLSRGLQARVDIVQGLRPAVGADNGGGRSGGRELEVSAVGAGGLGVVVRKSGGSLEGVSWKRSIISADQSQDLITV